MSLIRRIIGIFKKPKPQKSFEEHYAAWSGETPERAKERLTLFAYDYSILCAEITRVKGLCAVYQDEIECWEDGKKAAGFCVRDLDGAYLSADGNVSKLVFKSGEKRLLAAAGDMKYKTSFGAVAGALDRYFAEGTFIAPEKHRESVCPKCGRPYRPGSTTCPKCGGRKKQLLWLFEMVKPALPLLCLSLVLFVGFSAVGLIPPLISEKMVDGYLKNPEADSSMVGAYLLVVLSFFGITAAQRLLAAFRELISVRVGSKTAERLRASVFDKVQKMSLAGIHRRTAGELMQRINSDTAVVRGFLIDTLGTLIEQVFTLIAIGVIFLSSDFAADTHLFLLVFLPVIPAVILFRLFHRRLHRMYHMQWNVSMKANSRMHDIFSGIRVVKSFGREKSEIDRYDESITSVKIIQKRNETFWGLLSPAVNFLFCIGEFLLLYFVLGRVLGDSMTIGQMTKYTAYASMIYGPLRMMAFLPRRVTHAMTSVSKIYDVMNDEEILTPANAQVTKQLVGRISFKNVTFGYLPGKDVLRHIDLEIRPGEMVGLVGRSGVGKSTLTNLIMRLYDANEGQVLIDGVNVKDLSPETLRRGVGAVLQETFLFSGSIRQNICYAKPEATGEEIIAAAKLAGAHDFIMRMPDGYDSYVGEKGNTLSGGERQRIAIARALLHDPKILILDEATSSLDTETEKQIQDALQNLTSGRTTIAIAHRLSTLRNATRIIVLDDKRIAEQGSHEELMRNENGIYYGLVMAQRKMAKKSEE